MQDRYAGDVGDFLKLGLLRWLTAPPAGQAPLTLGVVWYLARDESHNADGKHISYLTCGHRDAARLRALDPDLYDRLATVVASGDRGVAQLERADVLPPGTVSYREPLDLSDLPLAARADRMTRRRAWLGRALAATAQSQLVFADPDNGMRSDDHTVPRYRTKAVKHAYLDELAAFAVRGQSLVVYHHADRSSSVAVQAHHRLNQLASETGATPVAAVRASRGTTRLFLIVAAPEHTQRLGDRVDDLRRSPWSAELVVYG